MVQSFQLVLFLLLFPSNHLIHPVFFLAILLTILVYLPLSVQIEFRLQKLSLFRFCQQKHVNVLAGDTVIPGNSSYLASAL